MQQGMSSQFTKVPNGPIPFPVDAARALNDQQRWFQTSDRSLNGIEDDRRMNVLARQLRCFVYYDNDSDDPCAA